MFLFLGFNEVYMKLKLFLIEIKVKGSIGLCLPSKEKYANKYHNSHVTFPLKMFECFLDLVKVPK